MIKPSDIIKATGSDPNKPVSKTNFLGLGFCFHGPDPTIDPPRPGKRFYCSGPDKHIIMELLEVPVDGREWNVVPCERADEAKWELSPEQESMDPSNPVCQICQSTIIS